MGAGQLLAILFSFVYRSVCQSCRKPAGKTISVPIRNVSVQFPAFRRGVTISVGTPPQTFAFQMEGYVRGCLEEEVTED